MKNEYIFVMYLMQNLFLIKLEGIWTREQCLISYLLRRKFKCAKEIALHAVYFSLSNMTLVIRISKLVNLGKLVIDFRLTYINSTFLVLVLLEIMRKVISKPY